MFTRTKPRTHPTSRLALANADEWTGEGGVEDPSLHYKEKYGKQQPTCPLSATLGGK